jgi:hypothetical protein
VRRSEHVEEPSLARLHQHLPLATVDDDVGEDQLLDGIDVPRVAGHRLVVPHELPGVRVEREDGRDIQVVVSILSTKDLGPRHAIAGPHVDQIGVWIVRESIPDGASAAVRPPLSRPGPGRGLERRVLERFRWITGNRVEAPELAAVVDGECREKAAVRGELAPRHADDHLPFRHAGRHRDRVAGGILGQHARRPERRSRRRVERHHAPIDDRCQHLALVERESPVDHATTDAAVLARRIERAVHRRIEAPELLPRAGVHRKDDAPVGDAEKDSVPRERSGLLAAAAWPDDVAPGQAQPAHIRGRDVIERTVTPLARIVAVRDPVPCAPRVAQPHVVEAPGLSGRRHPAAGADRHDDDQAGEPAGAIALAPTRHALGFGHGGPYFIGE